VNNAVIKTEQITRINVFVCKVWTPWTFRDNLYCARNSCLLEVVVISADWIQAIKICEYV
jgi:hypothetical protein